MMNIREVVELARKEYLKKHSQEATDQFFGDRAVYIIHHQYCVFFNYDSGDYNEVLVDMDTGETDYWDDVSLLMRLKNCNYNVVHDKEAKYLKDSLLCNVL